MSTSNGVTGVTEITKHLKNDSGFDRLMTGMFDLYNRYGRCFSAVRLPRPSLEEERALSNLFKRDYYDQALIRISLAEFERQLQKVFMYDEGLDAILTAYFGRSVIAQAEPRSDARRYKDAFTRTIRDDVLPKYDDSPASLWLEEMMSHMRRTYRYWADQFLHEPDAVLEMVQIICNIYNVLPKEGQLVRLSDFATQHLSNSRALDFHSPLGPLFLRALSYRHDASVPSVLEDSIRLYLQAGLLSDGVLSHVTIRGVKAEDEACAFYDQLGEAHVLTLENICRLGAASAYGDKVFIVESSYVFSALCERLSGHNCTLVCTGDGFNAAVERLLDLLIKSGAVLYYAGNIDYKGLTIADKLYQCYGKLFNPWRYSKADYELLSVGNEYLLPDDRKDLAMHNEELAAMLSLLRKTGKSASSLPLVGLFAEDICAMLNLE